MKEETQPDIENKTCLEVLFKYRNGCIVCIVSILMNLVRAGVMHTFGLYIAEFKLLYGTSMAELNWISLASVFNSFSFSSVATFVIRRYPEKGHFLAAFGGTLLQVVAILSSSFVNHIRWLFLTFGIMFGIGSCFSMMATSLIIGEFFPATHRYHIFSTSVYQCAPPAGILVFSTLYAWIIKNYSWRWCLRISALKIFIVGIGGSFLLLLKKPTHEGLTECSREAHCCRQFLDIFKTVERICWVIGSTLLFAIQLVAVNNLPHYMSEKGYDAMESSLSLTIWSAMELLTFIISPFFGHMVRGKLIYVITISCLGMSIPFFLWPLANSSWAIWFLSIALGIVGATAFVYVYPASGEAMDMSTEESWTITCTFFGVGALLEPVISGLVYDYTNSYATVFNVVASVCLIDFFIFAAIPFVKYLKQRYYEVLQ